MITEDDLLDALDDVDEEDLEAILAEADCFHTSLAKSIVAFATGNGELADLATKLNDCYAYVREQQRKKAELLAQDKDDARHFYADMRDDDWDDYKMRMTA